MGSIADLIASAAARNGVDANTLRGIGQIESGLNPNAKNPRSSAGGLFQFIDSTAGRYGLTNKFDPAASADAGARLLRDNGSFLQKRLGRAPAPGELYLAHQQGAGGAAKILSNPNGDAAATVGQRAFSLNGGRPGQTNAQFAQLWADKLNKALGGPAPAAAATPVGAGQAPQAGTSLADALPGATLPTGSFVVPVAVPDPAAQAYGQIAQQFTQRQQADATAESARRAALFGGGLGRLYG